MKPEKTYRVIRTENRSEALWLSDFSFPWLDREAPETRFRAWHHEDTLHFEFQVQDQELVLNQSDNEFERVLGSDRVELFFSPCSDLSLPYYGFEMDPRGLVYDYQGVFHRKFDPSWTLESLTTRAKLTPQGYDLEGSVPCNDLRALSCLKGNEMVTGIYRGEFSYLPNGTVQQDWISWINPGTKTPDFHVPESFGLFTFED